MNTPIRHFSLIGVLLLCCSLWADSLYATVIEWVGFEDLVAQSALIFRGEAIESAVERQGDLVYTKVTFAIDETLKGSAQGDTVTLRFVGGVADDFTVAVEGQFIPAIGDYGLYFVSSTQQAQVNPLNGWQQGYFPLLENEQGDLYLDMRHRPDFVIPGLEENPLIGKMKTLGFSAAEIEARFPQAQLFAWDDFRAAVLAETAGTATGGVAP